MSNFLIFSLLKFPYDNICYYFNCVITLKSDILLDRKIYKLSLMSNQFHDLVLIVTNKKNLRG